MPKTKLESVVFTLITAFIMVYSMTFYNKVLHGEEFSHLLFLHVLKDMWLEYAIMTACAYFLSCRLAITLTEKLHKLGVKLIFSRRRHIQIFTVLLQVAIASVLAVYLNFGFDEYFLVRYRNSYFMNFIAAFPIQILIAAPLAQKMFGLIFRKG